MTEGQKQGLAKGQIQALFTILATRGIPVDAAARAKIEACTDAAILNDWIARAMTIATAAELFEE